MTAIRPTVPWFVWLVSLFHYPIARIFTRQMHYAIHARPSWDATFVFSDPLMQELKFWLQNIRAFEGFPLKPTFCADSVLFTDASEFLLIGYFGLFRINEILRIRPCDIQISDSHLPISISSRKNDQHRDGLTSILVRSGKITCPVSITEKIMSLLPSTHKSQMAPIVRRVVKCKKQERFHEYAGICYSTALDSMRKLLAPLVEGVNEFATDSMRSGGASNAGFKSADPELKDTLVGRTQSLS